MNQPHRKKFLYYLALKKCMKNIATINKKWVHELFVHTSYNSNSK